MLRRKDIDIAAGREGDEAAERGREEELVGEARVRLGVRGGEEEEEEEESDIIEKVRLGAWWGRRV